MENLIHIAFDAQGAESLKQSFTIDDIIAGEVLVFEDDLSCGPLKRKESPEGDSPRKAWWKQAMGSEDYTPLHADAFRLKEVREKMRDDVNSEVWIWAAQNAQDVCGYFSLILPLEEFQGRVHIIYLNNLPFINEKGGIFYPTKLSEILPREFLKARKLAREITPAEMEMDGEEWRGLVEENLRVRILEGGKKIGSQEDAFFDKEITNRCRFEFMKAGRIINQISQKNKDHINEDFLLWRIRMLVIDGTLEAKAAVKHPRDLEIKLTGIGEHSSEGNAEEKTNLDS